jgi:hypothetical protein
VEPYVQRQLQNQWTQSSTGAASANTLTQTGTTGQNTYVSGFTVTGGGSTAGAAIAITLSNGTFTLNYPLESPAIVTGQTGPLVVQFVPPLNCGLGATATLTVPTFGAGNTSAGASMWGYKSEQ